MIVCPTSPVIPISTEPLSDEQIDGLLSLILTRQPKHPPTGDII
jgi:hypothetical protein